jgi:hypothetical protein
LSQVQYSGLTPLATSLGSKVLQPIVFSLAASGQLAKPVLIITITDGEPTDTPKDAVVQVSGSGRWRGGGSFGGGGDSHTAWFMWGGVDEMGFLQTH